MASSLRFCNRAILSLGFRYNAEVRMPVFIRQFKTFSGKKITPLFGRRYQVIGGVCLLGGFSFVAYHRNSINPVGMIPATYAASDSRPAVKPTRLVRGDRDSSGLHLTVYQYQSCPFCCKVRAYLDYHGFSYDVVEVNSLRRKELSFTKYKKVPIVVCQTDKDTFIQLNDSSLIISLLDSYMTDRTFTIEKLVAFYPQLESTGSRGKTVYDYPNKYFIMHGEQKITDANNEREKKDREWRKWVDDVLVHTLSPNIYRTPTEAIQSFRYFSKVGEWAQTFGNFEQAIIVYSGAAAMFVIGRILKKRHQLKDDVRESLYDACKEWSAAVSSTGGKFLGGDRPCLADLAVYGVLSSIEECTAFDDILSHTDVSSWYQAVKKIVKGNAGKREVVDNRLTSVM